MSIAMSIVVSSFPITISSNINGHPFTLKVTCQIIISATKTWFGLALKEEEDIVKHDFGDVSCQMLCDLYRTRSCHYLIKAWTSIVRVWLPWEVVILYEMTSLRSYFHVWEHYTPQILTIQVRLPWVVFICEFHLQLRS